MPFKMNKKKRVKFFMCYSKQSGNHCQDDQSRRRSNDFGPGIVNRALCEVDVEKTLFELFAEAVKTLLFLFIEFCVCEAFP